MDSRQNCSPRGSLLAKWAVFLAPWLVTVCSTCKMVVLLYVMCCYVWPCGQMWKGRRRKGKEVAGPRQAALYIDEQRLGLSWVGLYYSTNKHNVQDSCGYHYLAKSLLWCGCTGVFLGRLVNVAKKTASATVAMKCSCQEVYVFFSRFGKSLCIIFIGITALLSVG